MRLLMVLFMIMCLSLTPFTSYSRDVEKYTPEYNSYVGKSLGEEIYDFVGTLENLENNYRVRLHIMVNIFGIIDRYNCLEKLFVMNRGINFKLINNNISDIRITIYIVTSFETIDIIRMQFSIDDVKKGVPLKQFKEERKTS